MKTTTFLLESRMRSLRWHGLLLIGSLLMATSVQAAVTISGRVTDDGVGLSGIRINYSWSSPVSSGSGFVVSDGNGNWSSGGWGPATSIDVAPSQLGFTWSPSERSTSTGAGFSDISGLNFERISYSISGTVRGGGIGVEGVTVSLSGAITATTTTSSGGNYSFVRLPTGSHSITPSYPSFRFSPASL